MGTYLTCYRQRMLDNNNTFLAMAEKLKELGIKVYAPEDVNRLINFIYLEKEGKHIYFGFAEVPYRFYLNCNIEWTGDNGSCRTVKECFGTDNEWSAEYIISQMQSIPGRVPPGPKPTQYMREL